METEMALNPFGGEDEVSEKQLSPGTTEVVKGVLIGTIKNKAEAFERYFPEITDNGRIVTYEHVEHLTKTQAEFVSYEMTSLVGLFLNTENKLKNGYRGGGRPSILDKEPENAEAIQGVRIKRKMMEHALNELCEVFGLENPIA